MTTQHDHTPWASNRITTLLTPHASTSTTISL
jgi:hypothetical protein